MKAKKSTLTQVQAPLAQPVEAPPREKCELSTGLPRPAQSLIVIDDWLQPIDVCGAGWRKLTC